MLQFHSVGFVSGSNNTVANDLFCRRIAKLCDVIVLGVGYRCVILGVSCGGNIADYVTRKAVEAEVKLANSYFYDKETCLLAWKLLFPEEEFELDHPAANPLVPGRGPPLKQMPPTLTVVAEHDWMQDRAIAYAGELRKVNVDALFSAIRMRSMNSQQLARFLKLLKLKLVLSL
nr:probable carboxylesterase 11 [Ipomoea batatas]